MQVHRRDGLLVVSRITGPTHNRLALRLERGAVLADLRVKVLPSVGDCRHHDGLTAEEMVPAILDGIAEANRELGTDYVATYAEIVENDSRQPHVYTYLARHLVRAMHSQDA
ncbi:hypothetical protein [Sphingomonas kyeonggiensis]|uniref:Uncharacterized protein n=1 Tax=Sphingomonas kyeonggiensis TaxID=1268553 RepID=A0A7W6JVD1_9SPHN|nr:hypothetical protein [Sphingomonas kyeonggiensis]MBB4100258.1 hypothetical protein [Sphingomonas kyeonggiensis]